MESQTMKHVSKSTWERLKEESAADLHVVLHHNEPKVSTAPVDTKAPSGEQPPA